MMMKVLAVSSSAGLLGAAKSFELAMTGVSRERWLPVVVCPSPGPLAQALRKAGIQVHVLRKDPRINESCLEGCSFTLSADLVPRAVARARYIQALCSVIKRERPDLVYLNTIRNASSALAATACGRPVVWHLREPEADLMGIRALRLLVLKRTATRVVSVCDANRQFLVRKGVPADRIAVVPNGVDLNAFDTRRYPDAATERIRRVESGQSVVGMVGMWAPHKGVVDFLEMAAIVLADHPRTQFLLVGGPVASDPEYARVVSELLATAALKDRVQHVGYAEDVRTWMAQMDVLVLPSRLESFSRVLIEAMAMERAIVSTAVGGTPEAIVQERSGLLVPPGDPSALAASVSRVLDSPALAASLAREARLRAEMHFSAQTYVERLEQVWASVVTVAHSCGENGAVPCE